MKRTLLIAPLLGTLIGCNALLGNDESTANDSQLGTIDNTAADGGGDDSAANGSTSKSNDAGTVKVRDDSTTPCTGCASALVAKGSGHDRSIRVDNTHVYFSDGMGVHRIARGAPSCISTNCLEHLFEKSNYSGFELAANDVTSQMCWIGQQTFGCADTKTLVKKTVSLDAINVSSSITGLTIVKGDAYAVYDGNRKYIGKAQAAALVGETGQFGNTVTASYTANGFAINETHIAWEETDLSQTTQHIYVRDLAGGEPVEIPIPANAHNEFNRNLALWNGNVYFSRNTSVYLAPIDGSAEAVPLANFHRPGQLVVSAIGVVAACGGDSSGSVHGVEWSPLLPPAPGKAARTATQLASATDEVTSVAVSDDSIYFSVVPFSGDVGAGVWKIPFE